MKSLTKFSLILLTGLFMSGCFLNDPSTPSNVASSPIPSVSEPHSEPSSEPSSTPSSEPSSAPSSAPSSEPSSSSSSEVSSSSSVYEYLVTKIKLNNTSFTLNVGKTITIKTTISPLNASHPQVVFSSLNEDIATVEQNGKVKGISVGETTIRVDSTDGSGVYAEAHITVNAIQVTSLTVTDQNIKASIGNRFYISYTLLPSNATDKSIRYEIEKPELLTVEEDGALIPMDEGTTKVTLYTSNPDIYGSATVTIKASDLTDFAFRDDEIALHVGETHTLKPFFYPAYASSVPVIYTSSDESVATVSDSGLIVATGIGTAVISAETTSGHYTDEMVVRVNEDSVLNRTPLQYGYEDMYNNHAYSFSHSANQGDVKWLVVPVWFTDSSNFISSDKKSSVRADIRTAFFGTSAQAGWRSVSSFYAEESFGGINIDGFVTDWYPCGQTASTYSTSVGSIVSNAYDWVQRNYPDINLADYDRNKDGVLDAIILIYGAPDYSVYNWGSSNFWAFCSFGSVKRAKIDEIPTQGHFMWASYDFMYQGNYYGYGGNAQARTGYNYGSGNCDDVTIDTHTYIHESGHLLGADDYYDYSGQYSPAGGFSMQDQDRGMHDPYSIMSYGWVDPYIPVQDCTITIKPFCTSGDLVLLTPDWNEYDSPFDEYILIELYTPKGVNAYDATHYTYGKPQLNGNGVRIWHVDARLAYTSGYSFSANQLTTNPSIPGYKVYPAMANSYYKDGNNRISVLGNSYGDYNLLQQIRNYNNVTYKCSSVSSTNDFYLSGDTFAMNGSRENRQFVKNGLLNSGNELGWKVKFESVSANGATLKISRV